MQLDLPSLEVLSFFLTNTPVCLTEVKLLMASNFLNFNKDKIEVITFAPIENCCISPTDWIVEISIMIKLKLLFLVPVKATVVLDPTDLGSLELFVKCHVKMWG